MSRSQSFPFPQLKQLPSDDLNTEELEDARVPPASQVRASWIDLIFQEQGRRLICWLPVGFALGAVLFFSLRVELCAAWGAMVAASGVVLLWAGWYRGWCRLVGFGLLVLGLGFALAALQTRRQPLMPALPTRAIILTGRVLAIENLPPRQDDDEPARRLTLADVTFDTTLDAGMRPLKRFLHVRLKAGDPLSPLPGSYVSVRALLKPPAPPALPGGRDMQRESWFSGNAGNGYALGYVTLEADAAHTPFLEQLREAVARRIERVIPGQTGAIAATLLAGEGSGINRQTRKAFSASGLAHLLAVAGLHLGLVMAAVIVSIRAILVLSEKAALYWPCREISALAGLVAGGGYVLLTGAHLPSVRAFGMACIVTLALLTGRSTLSMRALSMVALLVLVVSPSSVGDVSFQMSFAAVMGLIAGYEVLREPLIRLRGEGGWQRVTCSHLVALALTSLLAGLATLPVSMAHFGAFQPWFVLANLIAVPLAAIWIMPAGLISILLMPFHAEALPLRIMGKGVQIVQILADKVAAFPMAHHDVPSMPGWGLLAFMLGLAILCLWVGRGRLAGLPLIALAVVSIWFQSRPVLLLSPDAGLIAVVDRGVLKMGPHSSLENIVLDDWQQDLALPVEALPSACNAGLCRVRVQGHTFLLRPHDPTDGETLPTPEDCKEIELFVSASPARRGCPGVPTLDRFSAWRDGAWAVYLSRGKISLVSDRSWRGSRTWVPAIGSHGMPNLPLARSE
ncbi:ComEC/Rec2 family competence protein [Gluconobacter wancherniae]|uniref:ComEC/Rec2 family competence protein n=1 Tax=Gluconobacter wancherniae TaxID=1307955 RepID=UPI0031FEA597